MAASVIAGVQQQYLPDGRQTRSNIMSRPTANYKIELVSALSDNGAGDVIETFTPFYEKDPSLSGNQFLSRLLTISQPHVFTPERRDSKFIPLTVFSLRESSRWNWFPE